MNKIPQTCEFYTYDVPNHAELKEKILKGISDMGAHSFVEGLDKISNTDWHLKPDTYRPYFPHLHPLLVAHVRRVGQLVGVPEGVLNISGYWFQQYAQGDYHGWHIHENSVFSNVYYVDLPEGASKTSFSLGGKEFEVSVKEGQILTFPSCFLHCSKANSAGVKTVVSFNC
jgi:hypothetical protein